MDLVTMYERVCSDRPWFCNELEWGGERELLCRWTGLADWAERADENLVGISCNPLTPVLRLISSWLNC